MKFIKMLINKIFNGNENYHVIFDESTMKIDTNLESSTRQMGRERAIVFAKALKVHPAVLLFPDFDIEKVA